MKQGATAPATPAANRRALRTLMRVGAAALGFQVATAYADTAFTLAGVDDVQRMVRVSLLETAPAATVPAALQFSQPAMTPAVRTVRLKTVRLAPIGTPQPKPAVIKTALAAGAATRLKSTLLLGSRGKPVSLTPVSQRWQRALGALQQGGGADAAKRRTFRAYSAILDQVKDKRRGLQIPKVNYMVNRLLAYREDHRLWNQEEYWANPVETLNRRAGDCEDYAILKYALLRDLGVSDADMRIVVLRDTAARQYHAVLSVRQDGKWMILDNRFSRIRFERDLPHYKAMYSVNAAGEWAHTAPKPAAPVKLAARLKALSQQ